MYDDNTQKALKRIKPGQLWLEPKHDWTDGPGFLLVVGVPWELETEQDVWAVNVYEWDAGIGTEGVTRISVTCAYIMKHCELVCDV